MEIAARFEARLRETRNTRNLIFLPSFGHLEWFFPKGSSPDLLSSSRNQFARVKFLPFPFSFFTFFFFQRFEEPFASWGRRVEDERKNVVVVDGSFTSEIFKRLGENSITRIDVGVIYLERHLEKCKQSKGGRIR